MGKPNPIGLDRLMRLPDLSADLRTTGGDRPFHAADERRVFVERDVFSLAFALQNLLWGTTYQNGIRCDSCDRRTTPPYVILDPSVLRGLNLKH
jgi:hypothetical protein